MFLIILIAIIIIIPSECAKRECVFSSASGMQVCPPALWFRSLHRLSTLRLASYFNQCPLALPTKHRAETQYTLTVYVPDELLAPGLFLENKGHSFFFDSDIYECGADDFKKHLEPRQQLSPRHRKMFKHPTLGLGMRRGCLAKPPLPPPLQLGGIRLLRGCCRTSHQCPLWMS